MQCIALPLDWLSGCGGLPFACCRIWLCLAAICRWQGAKAHSLFQNLLSYLSYASYTSYPLAPHKREAPFMLFDCIQILEVLLFAMFSVEEFGVDCRQRESAGNDIENYVGGLILEDKHLSNRKGK